jgi:hypothetical protein
MQQVTVFSPVPRATTRQGVPAPRLGSLDGKVVGFLDNGKLNAREMLNLLEEWFRARFGTSAVRLVKPSSAEPLLGTQISELAACDAVVTAVGD